MMAACYEQSSALVQLHYDFTYNLLTHGSSHYSASNSRHGDVFPWNSLCRLLGFWVFTGSVGSVTTEVSQTQNDHRAFFKVTEFDSQVLTV